VKKWLPHEAKRSAFSAFQFQEKDKT